MPLFLPPPVDNPEYRLQHFVTSQHVILLGQDTLSEVTSSRKTIDKLKTLPDKANVTVFIKSPGGSFSIAEVLAAQLYRLSSHCYTEYAASAAFEIVLPACGKRYALASSLFIFHSVQYVLEALRLPPLLNEEVSLQYSTDLKKDNNTLVQNVVTMIGASTGCSLLLSQQRGIAFMDSPFYTQIKDRPNPCLLSALLLNMRFLAKDFVDLTDSAKTITILPKEGWLFPSADAFSNSQ